MTQVIDVRGSNLLIKFIENSKSFLENIKTQN